jgi:hypothetical protein
MVILCQIKVSLVKFQWQPETLEVSDKRNKWSDVHRTLQRLDNVVAETFA